ncbi:MAG: pantetheine-phosphate adenylyltransferase [Zetaproteobacteria bacterium]|nr:MAG: pantetheine-phosphate adenylyltransferase [Zetaproteobacteria bacterium]
MTRAVYPGTFDPITWGHVDVVRRGLHAFDEVVVAVAEDTPKDTFFTTAERVAMAEETFADEPRVRVMPFAGLLVRFARKIGARVILRGLRAASDFEYEFQMATMNRRLQPELETFFVAAAEEYTFVSSSLIREITAMGGDVSAFVPPAAARRLQARFGPGSVPASASVRR